jgi:uncharacterized membrane protein
MNKLDFNDLFTRGWEKLMPQIGPAILWTLVFAIGEAIVGALCMIVIGIVILPVWLAGYMEVMKKLFHGEAVEFGDFLTHMNKLGNLFVALLLVGLGTAVGMICLVLPGIALSVLWSMTFFLVIDKDMDAVSAMKASFNRVKEEFWMMLGLVIVLYIINAIGGMVFGVGVLITMPFMMLVMWAAYYVLFPKEEVTVPTPPLQ